MSAAIDLQPVTFQYRVPRQSLSGLVGLLWYWRGYEMPYAKERVLPGGAVELVINLGSPRASRSVISGIMSESVLLERTAQDEWLGIHFNPGGVFPFLGFPSGELHNLSIGLDDLWGERRAERLLCLLNDAQTIDLKFQVVENWLMQIANRPLQHHPAVSYAIEEFQRDPGLLSSAEVAEKVNLSQRRFIQLFRDEVGMTPKLFCRVQRFQRVVQQVAKRDAVDWLDVSLGCGYFDQAHFIHDFKEFAGVTPTDYLTLRTEHQSHLLVRD